MLLFVAVFGNKVECCFDKVERCLLLLHRCWCGRRFTRCSADVTVDDQHFVLVRDSWKHDGVIE